MEKIGANLRESANYFVQLFYKTGQRYTCTQTKIGKLLSILAFLYARKGKILFDETIYRYNGCGAVIDNLKMIINDRDVYLRMGYDDFCGQITEPIDESLFDVTDDSLKKYRDIENLSSELKKDIEKVFIEFGAYSAYDIGQLINAIVNCEGITGYNEAIDLQKIATMTKNDFEQSNILIDYLFAN